MAMKSKREISLERATKLKSEIIDFLDKRGSIEKGLELSEDFQIMKNQILKKLNATTEDWENWEWQMQNRFETSDDLKGIFNLTEREYKQIDMLTDKYRWSNTPYYTSIMSTTDILNPVNLIGMPTVAEMNEMGGKSDPMAEEFTNPAGCITRRYPDRLILNVTNQCASYCRHCQRRRHIGQKDTHKSRETLQNSIDYIKDNPEIRDVLITGGDALMLSNSELEWIVSRLRAIKHVEILRLGSRTPVTLPMRITDELCDMLKKYHPIYLNTHFNHPREITPDAKKAAEKLANAGIPVGNQMVMLNGVNNDKYVVEVLNHELLKIRIRPYYIFHPKKVIGTSHFRCSVDDGLEIMEHLRGRTSGMAIPTYIVNAPGGLGKTPILPQYLISRGKNSIKIRTWEGNVLDYPNSETVDIKKLIK
jgi:glutamate 2,3-aminomutase